MTDEKVNANPEEKRASEAPAPAGQGDPSAPEHTGGRCYPLVRIRRLPPMQSLPRSMRERAVASLAWRRTAPPGQGISGISRQLRTGAESFRFPAGKERAGAPAESGWNRMELQLCTKIRLFYIIRKQKQTARGSVQQIPHNRLRSAIKIC